VEARAAVEISQREGEASDKSMGGETWRKEAYLRDIARVVFTDIGVGVEGFL